MALQFDDGIRINTEGEPRALKLWDGWYAVGNGMSIPCADKHEAEAHIAAMASDERANVR